MMSLCSLAESARLLQDGLDFAACSVQPHLDTRQRQVEQFGDLTRGHTINVVQQQHGLVSIGELGDVRLYASTHLGLLDDGERGCS